MIGNSISLEVKLKRTQHQICIIPDSFLNSKSDLFSKSLIFILPVVLKQNRKKMLYIKQEYLFDRNLHSESSKHPSQLFPIYFSHFLTYWHCFHCSLKWNINLIYLLSFSYLYYDPFSLEKSSVSEDFHACFLRYAGDYIDLFILYFIQYYTWNVK